MRFIKYHFTVAVLFLVCCVQAKGQPLSSDSLIQRAGKTYQNDPSLAYNYAKQAIVKAKTERSDVNLGRAYEILGISLDYLGHLDSALIYFDRSIDILKHVSDAYYVGRVYVSKANSLYYLNKNKEALNYYLSGLEIMKKSDHKKDEAACLMGIANVYSAMKFNNQSLKYYSQALIIYQELDEPKGESYILTNIAVVYGSMGIVEKEMEYEARSLRIKEKLNDEHGLVYSYSNMAKLMCSSKKKDSALYFANKAIATSKRINNLDFLTSSYKSLGNVYYVFEEYDKAIEYDKLALELSRKTKHSRLEHGLLKSISDIYMRTGNYKEAANTLLEFIKINDSINSLESKKSFNELQTQYETDKKEKEISLLNERDKKREVVIYSIIGLSLLLGILSFVLFNRFRLKKRAANELEIRNAEISKQKYIIEEKQKEITDSIHYAKRIQNTLLAHKDFVNKFIPDNFVLFKPKDIVSGDFYWAAEHNDKFYLAVCDSTGHGVPGAFMSLLNIGFLSEAIKEKDIAKPNEVFNYVRKRLIESMGNEGQKDGMDAVLICIDKKERSISYSAANNEPILLRNNELVKMPKDKMPVGHGEIIKDFNLYTINYKEGDLLYLYTDGFADQFGGPKGKKFKYKALNELLVSIHRLTLVEQHNQLNTKIADWMGSLEQVDDICIMGIKF
ncbi:MAG: SpoIIE family protein phosphatase [Bacteroidota bacterium]